jgi:hypothetical protein
MASTDMQAGRRASRQVGEDQAGRYADRGTVRVLEDGTALSGFSREDHRAKEELHVRNVLP